MTTTSSAQSALLQGSGLPRFEAITPDLVRRDIPVLLADLEQDFSALEGRLSSAMADAGALDWDEVMPSLQRIGERLHALVADTVVVQVEGLQVRQCPVG